MMMIFGEENHRGRNLMPAMGKERSKPLHNFKMPCLKWRNQRLDGHVSSPYPTDQRFSFGPEVCKDLFRRRSNYEGGRPEWVGRVDLMKPVETSPSVWAAGRGSKRKSQAEYDVDHSIKAFKAQLIFDFEKAVEKLNDGVINEGSEEQPVEAPPSTMVTRPWYTRKRPVVYSDFNVTGAVSGNAPSMVGGRKPNFSPVRTESRCVEVPRKVIAGANSGLRREREKFSAALSRKEIEEDFMALTGKKAPRRPKKRPKKDLEKLLPSLWFTEVTADMYKVPQAKKTRKK